VDVNSKIEEQLSSHNILLYMKGTPDFPQCGFSGQTVAALNAVGKPFAFVNIFEDEEIRQGLKTYSNWPTFPQLYVKGELIGGSDIVVEMYHSGELKELLDVAAEAAPTSSWSRMQILLSRLVALAHPCAPRHKVVLTKKPLPQVLIAISRCVHRLKPVHDLAKYICSNFGVVSR